MQFWKRSPASFRLCGALLVALVLLLAITPHAVHAQEPVNTDADLWLHMSIGSGVPKLDRPLTYTLEVINLGPGQAQDVIVTDKLPANSTFVSASSPCVYAAAGHQVTCAIGALDVNWWQATVSLTVIIQPTAAGALVNTAMVSSPNHDSYPDNNSGSVNSIVSSAPTSGITGIVHNAAGDMLAGIQVKIYLQMQGGYWGELRSVSTDSYGEYYTAPLETGIYRLRFSDPSGVYAFEYYNNQPSLAGATDIAVIGELVTGINVVLELGGSITGRVEMYDGQAPGMGSVIVYQWDGANWREMAWAGFGQSPGVSDPYVYTVRGLATGAYRLRLYADYQGASYSKYYLNASDVTAARDVVVTAGSATPDINLVLGDEKSRISGHVTAQDGSSLANIRVTAYLASSWMGGESWMEVRSTSTNATGDYSMAALDAGAYALRFSDPNGTYAFEYYNNAAALAGAARIDVAQDTAVTGINVVLELGGSITGRVEMYDGQAPGMGSVIVYQWDGANWREMAWAGFGQSPGVSDPYVYTVRGLATGAYRLRLYADYQGASYSKYYLNASDVTAARDVVVTAGSATPDINLVLGDEKSRISGHVTAQDGSSLANIRVTAYLASSWMGGESWMEVRSTSTNATGDYSMAALDAGAYALRFSDPNGTYAFEYYNNAAALAGAARIDVAQDTAVTGINVVLELGGSITGRVEMYDGQAPGMGSVIVYQWDGANWREMAWAGFGQSPGVSDPYVYTVRGLATGAYRLRLYADYQGASYSKYYLNASDVTAARDVVVTAGSATPDINLVLGDEEYTGRISGLVTGAAGPLPRIRVELYQDSGWGNGWWRLVYATTKTDGSYTIGGLRDGNYRVRFVDPNGVLASLYYDGKADSAGANTVTISGQNQVANINGNLMGAGAIAGQVSLSGGGSTGGLEVTAYRSTGSGWEALGRASTDTAGLYRIGGLPAGSYRVYFAGRSNMHRPEYYADAQEIAGADDVAVTADTTTNNINALLEPPAPPAIAVSSPGASVASDPATGQVTVMTSSSRRSDTTITRAVACPIGAPADVQLLFNGSLYPMTEAAPDLYQATIPAGNITTGDLIVAWQCNATPQQVTVGHIVLFDPSGKITDQVTGQPIANATVTLYRVPNWLPDIDMQQRNCRTINTRGGSDWSALPPADVNVGVMMNPVIDAASMAPAVNPQATNDQGGYGWNVAQGCYFVVVSAPGYSPKISPIVGVPPAVTDLNLTLMADAAPVAALVVPGTPVDLPLGATSFTLPVVVNGAAGSFSSTAFSLDYDTTCLSINPADTNGDGIPDAISGLPGGFVNSVMLDTADNDGELDVAIWDVTPPLATMPAGAILNVKFDILGSCQGPADHSTYVRFSTDPVPSFSDTAGNAAVRTTQSADSLLLDYNAIPTAILLSPSHVAENAAAGTTVGMLSVTDPDGNAPTYAFVTSCTSGSPFANGDFSLTGNTLKTAVVFDREASVGKSICVEANDGQGGIYTAPLTIAIDDVNEPPTDITLSNNKVVEGVASGSVVGTFSTSGDPEAAAQSTFVYAPVSGDGSADNDKFTIDGNALKTNAAVDFATQPVYYIRVRSQDNGAPFQFVEKQFVINVLDHSLLSIGDDFVLRHGQAIGIPVVFTANGNAPTSASFSISYNAACLTYVGTSGGTGSAAGGIVTVVPAGPFNNGTLATINFSANLSCPSGTSVPLAFTAASLNGGALPVNTDDGKVLVISNSARGDCNSDGFVNAGDFSAIVLETFDADQPWWLNAPQSTFPGSPVGCDANASTYIDVADVVCTVLVVFGNSSCTGGTFTASAATEPAILAVEPAVNDQAVEVPVTLNGKGATVAGAAFTLTYDPQQATFDTNDADGDGLPDAVVFATGSSLKRSVSVDAASGRIKIAVYGLSLPLPTVADGLVATVRLQAQGDRPLTGLSVVDAALGNDAGSNTPVEVEVNGAASKPLLYLPAVSN